jgi:hypothetical protein
MYPESELKMREQKYTTHILNSKIALLTMKKLNGDGDEEDDFIESKVLNAPTEVKALPGTMLGKLFSSEGKPQQAIRSFVQPPPLEELKAQELLEKKQVVMPPLRKTAPPQLAMLPLPELPALDTTADSPPLPNVPSTTMLNAYNISTTEIHHNHPSSFTQQQPPPFQQQQHQQVQQPPPFTQQQHQFQPQHQQ